MNNGKINNFKYKLLWRMKIMEKWNSMQQSNKSTWDFTFICESRWEARYGNAEN